MFCPECGYELRENAVFCDRCGAPVSHESQYEGYSGANSPMPYAPPIPGQDYADEERLANGNYAVPIPGQEYTDKERSANGNYAPPIPGQEYGGEKRPAGKQGVSPAIIGVAAGVIAIIVIAAIAAMVHFGGMSGDGSGQGEGSSSDSPKSSASENAEAGGNSLSSASGDVDGKSSNAESSEADSGPSEQAVSASAESSAAPVEQAAPEYSTFENENVRITMPIRYADEGYSWSSTSSETVTMKRSDGAVMCEIMWGSAASHEYEAKNESYIIGEVSHGSIAPTVFLRINYLDDQGRGIHWGSSETGTLATDLLGVDVQELVSWIELYSNGFRPASISSQSSESSDDRGYEASLNEPFYGVWISASKDYDEALATAASANVAGSTGSVFMTTDWENLNDEPWYVVTVGVARTESEAQALCERAHEAGYVDAYVKYSGAYIGPSQ